MADDIDTVLFWETPEDCQPNKCRVRIYWLTWEKAMVIATDLPDNPHRKIANATHALIRLVRNIYDIAPNKLMLVMLVEH